LSCGLVCLDCRAYLAACSCEWPIPSADGKTPLEGAVGGVDRAAADLLVRHEQAIADEGLRRASLPRAERRRLEREEDKAAKKALRRLR
jgi:hypothetical protein